MAHLLAGRYSSRAAILAGAAARGGVDSALRIRDDVEFGKVVTPDDDGKPLLEYLASDTVRRAFERAELRRLLLPENVSPSPEAIDILGHHWAFESVTHLNTRPSAFFSTERVEALAESSSLRGLEILRLAPYETYAEDTWKILASSRVLAGLRELTLHQVPNATTVLEALADSPQLAGVERLGLTHLELTDPAIEALDGSGIGWSLVQLRLASNRLSFGQARRLARTSLIEDLESLDLRDLGLDRDATERLAGSKLLRSVWKLDASHNPVGTAGVRALAQSKHAKRIEWLGLADTGLEASGLEALARTQRIRSLRFVDVANNGLGATEVERLRSSDNLTGLHRIRLDARGSDVGRRAPGPWGIPFRMTRSEP